MHCKTFGSLASREGGVASARQEGGGREAQAHSFGCANLFNAHNFNDKWLFSYIKINTPNAPARQQDLPPPPSSPSSLLSSSSSA